MRSKQSSPAATHGQACHEKNHGGQHIITEIVAINDVVVVLRTFYATYIKIII